MCLESVQQSLPGLKPTTWEAAQEYLTEEHKKLKGSGRNLLREMCMIYVLKIDNNQKIGFVSESTKHIFPLYEGQEVLCLL
jgi:hypothetical protein